MVTVRVAQCPLLSAFLQGPVPPSVVGAMGPGGLGSPEVQGKKSGSAVSGLQFVWPSRPRAVALGLPTLEHVPWVFPGFQGHTFPPCQALGS